MSSLKLTDKQVHDISRALADPRRYQILKRLGTAAQCTACQELLKNLPITAATLSHHIKELEYAGLISYVDTTWVRNGMHRSPVVPIQ